MDTITSIWDKDTLDLELLENAFGIKLRTVSSGMSAFQINHFVLNRQEFPNDYAQFLQARTELYLRANIIIDLYFQYRECAAKIKLAQGRIEKTQKEEQIPKIKEAKTELQNIEIDKNRFRMDIIKNQAEEKVKEASVFYKVYSQNKHFETDAPEQVQKAEEEYWKMKSAYYPELWQRYCLTPEGFKKLPHELGGLDALADSFRKSLPSGRKR